MTRLSLTAQAFLLVLVLVGAAPQPKPNCVENSPERRGEPGCSIVARKPLPLDLPRQVFWHIDRFETTERATAAAGPSGLAVDGHGASWLFTIETNTADHHGGRHVASVGPLPLPPAKQYSMQVLSAIFTPGMGSSVHQHSGVEAWYVIEGSQCLETPTKSFETRAGETFMIPAGETMHLVATGTSIRRAFAVIVHDAAKPPTTVVEATAPLVSCK